MPNALAWNCLASGFLKKNICWTSSALGNSNQKQYPPQERRASTWIDYIKTNTFCLVSGWFLRRLIGKISGYNRCKIMGCLSLCEIFFGGGGITWHHREFSTTDQKPFHESCSGLTLLFRLFGWWGLVVKSILHLQGWPLRVVSRGPQLRGYRGEISTVTYL